MSVVPKCDEAGCTDNAIRVNSRCRFCKLNFCWAHFENETSHPCVTAPHPETNRDGFEFEKEPEASEILRHLDMHAIKAEVESIWPGHICNYVGKPQIWHELARLCGQYNHSIVLGFADGQRWAMRIRLKQRKYLPDLALEASIDSEIATARALESAGCAVPRTWERPRDSLLSRNLTYFYQEFVPVGDCTMYTLWTEVYTQQTKTFIRNFAKWMISLEKVHFDKMGSLTLTEDGDVTVGPFIERRTTIDVAPYFLGPFNTAKEGYLAIIDVRLEQTLNRARYKPSRELLHYLVLLEVRHLVQNCCPELDVGPWYIRHNDDDTNFVRVTSEGSITGVIDWKWATLTSKGAAFAAPFCFPDDKYSEGVNALGVRELALIEAYRELDRNDLAELVRTGRKFHRLFNVLFHECVTLTTLNALRRAFLGLADGKQGLPQTLKEWIQVAKQNYADDENLPVMLKRSDDFVKNSKQAGTYSEHWGLR
ncbi:hypothetical protein L198_01557 [Cryptococcus wingfieldii CBS 7118]|uniref:Aminoglycoside phosphotransferase domain-containing protein n=1 Tax=Cryptococcus wingfieldii CBS 7118 TaxID=1295528 RepID=A0A1E3JZU8_9TREE|nr:hypothetical protein L198_01557 [Cryptococcus wingfieldii CBS 7118]ODO06325.1 hypothetical protein L198_01557 [Cryptococcus wingfieldii CBS 7118]